MSRTGWSALFSCCMLACGDPSAPPTDGAAWPTGRYLPAMAYDADRGRTVLFGGSDERYGERGEAWGFEATWEWDGARWTRSADTGPRPRTLHGMAYDRSRRAVVLHGGVTDHAGRCTPESAGRWCGDTWVWDGSAWIDITKQLTSRLGPSLLYDELRDRLLMVHGVSNGACFNGTCQELSTLVPEGWTPVLGTP